MILLRPNKIYQIRGPVNIRHTFVFIMSKYIFSAQNPLEYFELTHLLILVVRLDLVVFY